MKAKTSIPYLARDRANVGPFVHETEALERVMRNKPGRIHWTLKDAAVFESLAILKLLEDHGGKR